MKRTIFFTVVYLVFSVKTSFSQQIFMKEYGGGYSNHSVKIIKTLDGQLLMAGYIHDSGGPDHIYLLKVTPSGSGIWARTFDNTQSFLSDICANLDTTYTTIGFVPDTIFHYYNVYAASLALFNSQGLPIWIKTFADGTSFKYVKGVSVTRTSDKGFLMTVVEDSVNITFHFHALRLDSTGAIIWSKKFVLGNSEYPSNAFQLSDGNYIFIGRTATSNLVNVPFVMKTDTSGNVIWSKRYVNFTCGFNLPEMIETTDQGLLISVPDGSLIKTDSLGLVQWAKFYNSSTVPGLFEIIKDSSNNYIVSSYRGLLNVDTAGTILWYKEYVSVWCYVLYYSMLSVVQHSNGYLYALGKSWPTTNTAAYNLCKIEPNGGHCCEQNPSITAFPVIAHVDTPAIMSFPFNWTVGSKTGILHNVNSGGNNICAGLSVQELVLTDAIQIVPNPSNSQFVISSRQLLILKTEIFNLLGEKIYEASPGTESLIVNCATFPGGIYIANITTEKGTAVQKIVVQ